MLALDPFKRDMLLGFARNLTLNPASRRVGVDRPGETADLGVAVVKGIVKGETLNGNASQVLSFLHHTVKEMMGDNFKWNAVRIERGRKAKESMPFVKAGYNALVLCLGEASFVGNAGHIPGNRAGMIQSRSCCIM